MYAWYNFAQKRQYMQKAKRFAEPKTKKILRYSNFPPCVMAKWREGHIPPFNFLGLYTALIWWQTRAFFFINDILHYNLIYQLCFLWELQSYTVMYEYLMLRKWSQLIWFQYTLYWHYDTVITVTILKTLDDISYEINYATFFWGIF